MTASLYKLEASRLVEHLSAVHKIRFKHASSFEAIAAIHGKKDWNTLLAAPEAVLTSPAAMDITAHNALHQLFPEKSIQDPLVCESILSISAYIKGNPQNETEVLFNQLLAHQIQRGGFLFLDLANESSLDNIAWVSAAAHKLSKLRVVDFLHPENSEQINPLAGLAAEEIVDVVMSVLPMFDNTPGSDFYRQSASYALQCIVPALLDIKKSLSLHDLDEFFAEYSTSFAELEKALPATSPASPPFKRFLDEFRRNGKDGIVVDGARLKSTLGGLAGRIAQLCQGKLGSVLAGIKPSALSLRDAVANGDGVYIGQWDMPAVQPLIVGMLEASLKGFKATGLPPFTIFIKANTVHHKVAAELAGLANRAQVGLVLYETAPDYTPQNFQLNLRVEPASGFGTRALVHVEHAASHRTRSVVLENNTPWPAIVPPYEK